MNAGAASNRTDGRATAGRPDGPSRARAVGAALGAALLLTWPAAGEEPSPFALLAETRRAYAALDRYADRGWIVEVEPGGERRIGEFTTSFSRGGSPAAETEAPGGPGRASTVHPPDLEFRLFDPEGTEAAAWTASSGSPGSDAEVRRRLGPASAALVVPALLLGSEELEVSAAAFEEENDCGGRRCRVVAASRDAGLTELRFWLDAESGLVRRVDLAAWPADEAMARAAGAPAAQGGGRPRIFAVYHELLPSPEARPSGNPEALRAASATAVPEAGFRETGEAQAPFAERIEVRRLTIELRAVDAGGEPIAGLGAGDFRVRLGGRPARVEAVDRVVSGEPATAGLAPADLAAARTVLPATERLLLTFVQADFESSRLTGHLRLLQRTELLLEALRPGDRMAVVSFDSHLRLRTDFTDDRDRLRAALVEAIRFGGEEVTLPVPRSRQRPPALARHLDAEAARAAADPERALLVAARALTELAGPRSIFFLGWGLGRFDMRSGSTTMTGDYDELQELLTAAQVPVFVLDVADAAYHSLEVGLQTIAEDTGGAYERLAHFPDAATRRLGRVAAERYLLTVEIPAGLAAGEHRLEVDVAGPRGRALVPRTVRIR